MTSFRALAFAQRNPLLLLLAALPLLIILYAHGRHGFFVSDFFWRADYLSIGIWENIGGSAVHPFSNILYFMLYRVGGFDAWTWLIVTMLIHWVNGVLVFLVFRHWLSSMSVPRAEFISSMGTMLFLFSPYQTEAVIWGAAAHYLLVVSFILLALLGLLKFGDARMTGKSGAKWLALCLISAVLGVFTHEMAIALPLLAGIIIMSLRLTGGWKTRTTSTLLVTILPMLVIIISYFILNKIVHGDWAGHYGTEVHFRFTIGTVVQAILNYAFKFLAFFRYWGIENAWEWKEWMESHWKLLAGLSSLGVVLVVMIIRRRVAIIGFGAMILAFLAALLPVINLETTSLLQVQSDRYSYLALAFFYPLLILIFCTMWSRSIGTALSVVVLAVSIILLITTVSQWRKAGALTSSLIADYRWPHQPVYILNLPDNLHGVYALRNAFKDALKEFRNVRSENVRIVAWYNPMMLTDSVRINSSPGGDTIGVIVSEWGRWFHYDGRGAVDYETDEYKAEFFGAWYRIILKDMPDDAVFIYQAGTYWREFRPTK